MIAADHWATRACGPPYCAAIAAALRCGALLAIVVINGFGHDAREDARSVSVRVDGYPARRAWRRLEDKFVERGPRGGLSKRVCLACAQFSFTSFLGSGHGGAVGSEVKLFTREQLIGALKLKFS
jgi:hypothetical protein